MKKKNLTLRILIVFVPFLVLFFSGCIDKDKDIPVISLLISDTEGKVGASLEIVVTAKDDYSAIFSTLLTLDTNKDDFDDDITIKENWPDDHIYADTIMYIIPSKNGKGENINPGQTVYFIFYVTDAAGWTNLTEKTFLIQ